MEERDFFRPKVSVAAQVLALHRWRQDMGFIFRPEELPNVWDKYLIDAENDIREVEDIS